MRVRQKKFLLGLKQHRAGCAGEGSKSTVRRHARERPPGSMQTAFCALKLLPGLSQFKPEGYGKQLLASSYSPLSVSRPRRTTETGVISKLHPTGLCPPTQSLDRVRLEARS